MAARKKKVAAVVTGEAPAPKKKAGKKAGKKKAGKKKAAKRRAAKKAVVAAPEIME